MVRGHVGVGVIDGLMRGLSVVYGALSLKGCEGWSRCGEGVHRMWRIPRTFSGSLVGLVGLVNVGAYVCVDLF